MIFFLHPGHLFAPALPKHSDMPKTMEKGKGGKGKGKGKSKGVCKGGSAGVGGAYAAPGRPKIFWPTDEDRKQTGNIEEYFKSAEKTTPQPFAPVFASGARSATSSIPVPSTQMPVPTTGQSTQVIDVEQAAQASVAQGLARLSPFPAKRMLLVCDNASVHKADEIKTLTDKYGIILMFLPPNMTQWLQPLDHVVCGLIKIVQRARRDRYLAAVLKQWKDEKEHIVGER